MSVDDRDDGPGEQRSRRVLRPSLRLALMGIGALLVVTSPLWAPLILRHMAFFRVRRIEIQGARYVAPSDILARLHVDTTASVWDATGPLARRVMAHPEIARAEIERKLPGTLVVRVTERTPVALVPANGGFRVYDERGVALPIDPTRVSVDAPVMLQPDSAAFRLLGAMRGAMAALYARVSAVRVAGDTLVLELDDIPVRTMRDVTLDRLAEIEPVEADLNKKQLHALEIDLRYRDQVIARLQ
jgi:cell division protein FtsQ